PDLGDIRRLLLRHESPAELAILAPLPENLPRPRRPSDRAAQLMNWGIGHGRTPTNLVVPSHVIDRGGKPAGRPQDLDRNLTLALPRLDRRRPQAGPGCCVRSGLLFEVLPGG